MKAAKKINTYTYRTYRTETGRRYIVARWDGLDSYRSYQLKSYPDGIESQDGDEWHDGAGSLCKGAEFDAVMIKLIGGPRHGTMVG